MGARTVKLYEGFYGTPMTSKITGIAKQKRLAKKKRVKKAMKGKCK
jgi:hypothetical protein